MLSDRDRKARQRPRSYIESSMDTLTHCFPSVLVSCWRQAIMFSRAQRVNLPSPCSTIVSVEKATERVQVAADDLSPARCSFLCVHI